MTAFASGFAELCLLWVQATLAPMLVLMIHTWHAPSYSSIRPDLLLCAGAFTALFVIRAVSRGLREAGAFRERVLIVGTHPVVAALIDELELRADGRFTIIGVIDDAPDGTRTPGMSLRIGSIERLGEVIEATSPSR